MESSTTGEDNFNVEGYNSNNIKKARLNSTLAALLEDPILADVPKKPSLSDVDTLISLELGSAMRISVLKLDGTSISNSTSIPLPSSAWHFHKHVICTFRSLSFFLLTIWFFFFGGTDVAVLNTATAKDLKLAIKQKVNEMEQSKMGHRHISWFVFFLFMYIGWKFAFFMLF